MSLKDKVAIITGAGSGIGAATAIIFVKEGANVALVDKNQETLEKVVEKCEEISAKKQLMIVADLSIDDDVERIIRTTIKDFGKLDILVNNAGLAIPETYIGYDYSMEVFDKIMRVNFRAAVNLTNLAVKHLVESAGNIVNMCSVGGVIPHVAMSAYCSSKAALQHFSRCLALELAPKGVRVNIVSPGPVKTNIVENFENSKQIFDNLQKFCPINRISDPEEIADFVLYLASDKARSITGSCHLIDNGINLKGALI